MLALNPAFDTSPANAPDEAEDAELALAIDRLPSDIVASLAPGQIRRLAMLIAPDKTDHKLCYQISSAIGSKRYYFALFFGREKRPNQRLNREGQSRSFASLFIRFAMAAWLISTLIVMASLLALFGLYALKSVLGIDLFDSHFFMHPLLFKLGLLPGSG
jgi:hypothetical protein